MNFIKNDEGIGKLQQPDFKKFLAKKYIQQLIDGSYINGSIDFSGSIFFYYRYSSCLIQRQFVIQRIFQICKVYIRMQNCHIVCITNPNITFLIWKRLCYPVSLGINA